MKVKLTTHTHTHCVPDSHHGWYASTPQRLSPITFDSTGLCVIYRMLLCDLSVISTLPPTVADGIGHLGAEQRHHTVPVADPGAWATAMSNLGIVPMGLTGQQLVSGKPHSLSEQRAFFNVQLLSLMPRLLQALIVQLRQEQSSSRQRKEILMILELGIGGWE